MGWCDYLPVGVGAPGVGQGVRSSGRERVPPLGQPWLRGRLCWFPWAPLRGPQPTVTLSLGCLGGPTTRIFTEEGTSSL